MSGKSALVLGKGLWGASIAALAIGSGAFGAGSAAAQDCTGTLEAPCVVTVTADAQAVTASGATIVDNLADGTTVTQTQNTFLLVNNAAGASLDAITFAPWIANPLPPVSGETLALPLTRNVIVNAGTIDGNVLSTNGFVYVADGGTLNGNLGQADTSRYTSETIIDRSGNALTGGITGIVDGGLSIDTYAVSRGASGTVALDFALPTNFELHGVEVRGTGTTVTLTAPTAVAGLELFGDGNIVNLADINPVSLVGTGIPAAPARPGAINYRGIPGETGVALVAYQSPGGQMRWLSLPLGGALNSFDNRATIDGSVVLATASFANSGTLSSQSNDAPSVIVGAADRAFSFVNSGAITISDAGIRDAVNLAPAAITLVSAFDTAVPAPVAITNTASGTISGGLEAGLIASTFSFVNDGTIAIGDNGNAPDRAVVLDVGEFDVALDPALSGNTPTSVSSFVNNGTIDGGVEYDIVTINGAFTNTGTINRDPNDPYAEAINLDVVSYGPDYVIDTDSFAFTNSGTILGSTDLELEASAVTITNSGTMTQDRHDLIGSFEPWAPAYGALSVSQETTLSSTLAIINRGTISTADSAGIALGIQTEAGDIGSGVAGADSATATVSLVNSGLIEATGGNFVTPGQYLGYAIGTSVVQLSAAIGAELDSEGDASFGIVNEAGGRIVGGPAPTLLFNPNTGVQQLASAPASLAIAAISGNFSLSNAGEIAGGPGGVLTNPALYLAYGPYVFDLADHEGVAGGAIDTYRSVDTITNTGLIQGGMALRQGDDTLTNSGTITGSVFMGTGNDRIVNNGAMQGAVAMGDGNDVFITSLANAGSHLPASLDGGLGGDSFIWNVDAGGTLQAMDRTGVTGFEYFAIGGAGTVTSDGAVAMAPIQLALGDITLAAGSTLTASGEFALLGSAALAQTFTNRGTIAGSVDLGAMGDTFRNYGTLDGDLLLGDGDDLFVQGIRATFTGTADGGAGSDRFVLDIDGGGTIDQSIYDRLVNFETLAIEGTGTIATDGTAPLPVETIALTGSEPVVLQAGSVVETLGDVAITGSAEGDNLTSGAVIVGDVDLGEGDNSFANTGSVQGDVTTGAGADEIANTGVIEGTVATGDGEDMLTNGGTIAGDVATGGGDDTLVNSGTVAGDVALDGDAPGGAVLLAMPAARIGLMAVEPSPTGGDDTFANSGSVAGSVFAGAGDDSFTNTGSIGGNVDMGDGDDSLILSGAWSIGGTVTGGSGIDDIAITFAGSEAEPQVVDLSGFAAFETFAANGGTGKIIGAASFAAIDVSAGRLIGAAGSTIAGDVTVASGATFGSAGTVNGDIAVAGTLSPGASPGTMTVNGDVVLGATSTTVFEFTPTVSDALVVNGALDIVAGASLTLTGNRPLTPGAYTLISATGGIDGTFGSNVAQASTVFGFLTYSANAIQLVATFQAAAGASAQDAATVAYLNTLLTGGATPAGVLAAYPQLVTASGFANAAALTTLSPEAYASATEMGIDNGLAITRSLREIGVAGGEDGAPFVFGKAFGSWRDFDGDANGVTAADTRNSGLLGGIGFGNSAFAVGAFVGQSDSRQTIDAIAARTNADGLFFGALAQVAAGGFEAGASVVFDRSKATTVRAPLGVAAQGRYRLRGTAIDGFVGYGIPLGNWTIGPRVGLTHVSIKRGDTVESGTSAFALDVEGDKTSATFANADLRAQTRGEALKAWIEGGVRRRIDGEGAVARAGYAGTTATYAVPGVTRDKTVGHAGLGADFAVTANLSVFGQGDLEFGGDSNAKSVSGGISFRF